MSTQSGARSVLKTTTTEGLLRVETTERKDGAGNIVLRLVQKFDTFNSLVREERGIGADLEWTEYSHPSDPQFHVQSMKRSDGTFEKYEYEGNEAQGYYVVRTIRPWGDQDFNTATATTGHVTEQTRSQVNNTQVETTVEMLQGTWLGQTVRETTIVGDVQQITTKVFPTGDETISPIITYQERYLAGLNSRQSGNSRAVQNKDGTYEYYLYPEGYISNYVAGSPADVDFTEAGGGPDYAVRVCHKMLRQVNGQGQVSYLEIPGRTSETLTMYNSFGNAVIEDTSIYSDLGVYERVSRIKYVYDLEGRLVQSYREIKTSNEWRPIYSAVWSGNFLYSETDEAGITTTRGSLDTFGNPTMTTKSVSEGGISTTLEERHQTYDTESRIVSDYLGNPSAPAYVRSSKYNTAGNLSEDTINGVRRVYQRSTTAEGGPREIVRAGGLGPVEEATVPISVRDRWVDGRIKSMSGVSTVSENYNYELVSADWAIKTTVTRGSGGDAVTSISTAGYQGRRVSEKIAAPNGGTRTFEYYDDGRFKRELVNGTEMRSVTYSAPDAAVSQETEIIRATPSPDRTVIRKNYFEKADGVWWDVTESDDFKSMEKVGPWTAPQVAVRKGVRMANGIAVATTTTTEELAGAGKIAQSVSIQGAGETISSTTILRDGKSISIKGPGVAAGNETVYEYDTVGRVTLVYDQARNVRTSTQYDSASGEPSVIRTWGASATFDAAANDAKTETINAYYTQADGAHVTSWNRVKSVTKDGAMPTYFAYTTRGETAFAWGGTHPTWTEYDTAGRLWKLHTYRDSTGSINFYSSSWPTNAGFGDTTTWVYHPGTELLQLKLDASNQGPTFTYDVHGRLSGRVNAETGATVAWNHNLAGLPISVGQRSFTYDSKGRVTWISADFSEGDGFEHTIVYDPSLSYITDTSTSGDEVTSLFDGLGRQTGVRYKYNSQLVLEDHWNYGTGSGKVQSISSNGGLANWGSVTTAYTPSSNWLEMLTFKNSASQPILITMKTPDVLWRLKTTNTTRGDGTTPLPTTLGRFDYQYGPVNGDAKQRGRRVEATLSNGSFWKYG
jgi:hypothetical protein